MGVVGESEKEGRRGEEESGEAEVILGWGSHG